MKHFLALLALMVSVAACNTVEGIGQDLGALGHGIEKSAK